MKTSFWSMGLVILSTIFTATGQYFWKLATSYFSGNIKTGIFTNLPLWFGFVAYGLGTVLLILALRGGELSVLYPIIATSFIWVTLLSHFVFNETITGSKIIAIATIILGISAIGVGSR